MSMQAMTWVMTDAPVGADTRARVVLYALANFARPDGTGAYPSIATLVALSHLPKRTVQLKLAQLEANGVIRRGDQRIVAHIRADHRPVVRDLAMEEVDESGMSMGRTAAAMAETEELPGAVTAPRIHGSRDAAIAPRTGSRGAVMNVTGCSKQRHGVQRTAPNPKDKPTNKPKESAREENPIRIPNDWTPTPAHLLAARDLNLDITSEAQSFRSYHRAKGDRMADWDAAFDLWLRRGAEFKRRENPQATTGLNTHTHTYACDHVLALLHRETPAPDDLAVSLAMKLNQGMEPPTALHAIGLDDTDPLEQIA